MAFLGAAQFAAPPSHILNQQVRSHQLVIQHADKVRASGTFAFPAGMSNLSILGTWAACFLIFSRPKLFVYGIAFLVAALACTAAAVTRNGLFSSLIILAGALILTRRDFLLTGVFIALLLIASPMISFESITEGETDTLATATFRRHATSDSTSERVLQYTTQAYDAATEIPGGIGLGRCQSYEAARAFTAGDDVRFALGYEMEYARIIAEVGLLGLTGVLLMRLAFLWVVWEAFMSAHSA